MLSITKVRGNPKILSPHEDKIMVPSSRKRDIRHIKMPQKPPKYFGNDSQIRDLCCDQSKGIGNSKPVISYLGCNSVSLLTLLLIIKSINYPYRLSSSVT